MEREIKAMSAELANLQEKLKAWETSNSTEHRRLDTKIDAKTDATMAVVSKIHEEIRKASTATVATAKTRSLVNAKNMAPDKMTKAEQWRSWKEDAED